MKQADEKRRSAYDVFRRRESVGSAAGFHGSFRLHPHRHRAESGASETGDGHRRTRAGSLLREQQSLDGLSSAAAAGRTAGGDANAASDSARTAVNRRASAHPISPLATTPADVESVVMRRRGIDNPAFQPETVINMDDGGRPEDQIARRPSDPSTNAPGKEEKKP